MKILILGAGQQGFAAALDLLRERELEKLTFVDGDSKRLDEVWGKLGDPRVMAVAGDASHPETLREEIEAHDVVVSAVPYYLNLALAREAVAAKRHFIDMGGNTSIVEQQLALDDDARDAGIALLPDQGLAPGLANIIAGDLIGRFDRCLSVRIRVGGLPVRPVGPLGYRMVFSVQGLINEYSGSAEVLRAGRRMKLPALCELESFELPAPFGAGEAAVTTGGLSTMPATFEGKVEFLDYKSVRYAGHFEKIRTLATLGFFDEEKRDIGGGVRIAPRAVAADLLGRACDFPDVPDLIVCRVVAEGEVAGERRRLVVETLDFGEPARGVTSMMRMTAYPVAAIARRLARGEDELAGAFPPERSVPWDELRADLEGRGIGFTERESVVPQRHVTND